MSDLGTDSKAVFAANGRLYRQVQQLIDENATLIDLLQQLTDENFTLTGLLFKVVLEEAVLGRTSLSTLDEIKIILKGD
jgi:hypothetical protein